MKRAVFPLVAAFALTACSSVIPQRANEPTAVESISITTPAITGAECVFRTSDYTYTVKTPGTLQALPSNHDISYTCTHKGFKTARGVIPANKDRWNMTNMANAVMPGKRYDLSEGEKWHYPKDIEIEMIPNSGVAIAHKDIAGQTGSIERAKLDREFEQMLKETSWALHGGQPPAAAQSELKPVNNVKHVPVVKAAPPNATPQDGDQAEPMHLVQ